jgi:3-oxoadipate enol-lactonase
MVCAFFSNAASKQSLVPRRAADREAAYSRAWTKYPDIDKTSRSSEQMLRNDNRATRSSAEHRKMGFFRSGRRRLHYEDLGAGPPVVLLHGFTNYGLSWAPQLAAVVHAGYRAILPDLRGHGASAPATELCTVTDLALDIMELLDHLGTGPVVVCGLSLGGMVAMQMALDKPDRIAALVIANSRSSFTDPEMTAMVDTWTGLLLQEDGPLKRLHATWPTLVNASFRESACGHAAFNAWARVLATVEGASLCYVAKGMTEFDLRPRLATIRAPSLIISGEFDRLFPRSSVKKSAAASPGRPIPPFPAPAIY